MEQKIAQYKAYLKRQHAFEHAAGILQYDMETVMPRGAAEDFAETMGILAEESYKMETDPELIALVKELSDHQEELDPITRREVEVHQKSIDRISCIPMEEFVDYNRTQSQAVTVWQKAKVENDFAAFLPYLKKIIEYNRKFALYYAPDKDPYNTLLDQYEEGLTKETLDPFFANLASAFRPLIREIVKVRDRVDDRFLFGHFPVSLQRELSDDLMRVLCIDRNYCAIGEVEHPFTTNFSKHDVRITTHYHEDALASSFYSVVHEGGHALYELHTGDDLIGSPLASGTSMGIHESQSRLFENMIGRSREFVNLVFPKIVSLFPEQMKDVTAEAFYRAVNKSEPSLIRTEADELTYCFHIMIRYELEKQLIAGTLQADDLPEAWNRMYREYLGLAVPDDTRGVLQDSHWSGGSFGYFPSYAIGSAYAAQIMHAMQKDIDVAQSISAGSLEPVNRWLTEKIWKYGTMLKPGEVIRNACGADFDPCYYIDYLTKKYSELYRL
ncbi:MAG: carboxypeptidase M32 [Clostridia bacterium]|nr:carboxypeptidase M32 [Clostridia bacterium]